MLSEVLEILSAVSEGEDFVSLQQTKAPPDEIVIRIKTVGYSNVLLPNPGERLFVFSVFF